MLSKLSQRITYYIVGFEAQITINSRSTNLLEHLWTFRTKSSHTLEKHRGLTPTSHRGLADHSFHPTKISLINPKDPSRLCQNFSRNDQSRPRRTLLHDQTQYHPYTQAFSPHTNPHTTSNMPVSKKMKVRTLFAPADRGGVVEPRVDGRA